MIKIKNKQEYYSAMAEIESYLQKGFSNLSQKEEEHLEELSRSTEAWELSEFPMPLHPGLSDILNHIIRNLGLNQTELAEKLSVSKSHLSEIMSGKKQPGIELVTSLHDRFQIDADVLLKSVAHLTPKRTLSKANKSRPQKRIKSKSEPALLKKKVKKGIAR
jgi:antitoxin component HigA of HigAB toxin-antitoxin module